MTYFAQTPACLRRLLQSEDGAVTVDWIVLVALIGLIGMGVGTSVTTNVPGKAEEISAFISKHDFGLD
ncbi:hypothetical protein XMM379_000584 [Aliiroseovarius sp. xm-m-379]|uniref:Pilus assembly protein n=1 Tax=Aliiroseovarius crassostreae TaxID=154981 RepID=A0A0P7JP98_9RHOB|nr:MULTISPECIES: hypothetical protein [Aliiroseovarius]NRP45429.1 hypothetical protein [Aliiroseovarius sp. xm-m-378]NRQ03904.1 hypothetical protein [Aliiroseovarius sp. xm-m-309]KPN63081.1 hypothetical protein AKJ29_02755 [Aliiroseovarius crassostreae]NRP11416.1 hypothetical protein [Aliiroseovarius sp. xm-d-517]NRP23909.1 hypothetical protein [Aliiroseovarius sp. xm-m-379]